MRNSSFWGRDVN